MPTATGTVKSVTHTSVGSDHQYHAEFTYPNPSPPPDTLTVEFSDMEKEWYDDFRLAKATGSALTVTWTAGPPAKVSAVKFG